MSDMINEIVTKEAEEQLIRVTKLLKENMDSIKAHEASLRSATTSSGVRKATDELTKANEDFSKSEKEIIALAEKRRNLLTEQAKQVAELKAQNRSLLESQTKLAAVNESERNSLERAQKLILLYTNEKKKLNLATAEGIRMNENYNKAIQKANDFIIKNADVETKRAKNVGNYASSLAPLFNNLAASIQQAEIQVRRYTQSEGDQSPKTKQAVAELNALKNVFNDVSTQAALAGQTQEQFVQATKSSLTNLKDAGMQNTVIYRDLTTGLSNSITPTVKAAGGFNALGNSISQLTREAPAFANSVSTGFMAISNNIPALSDAIKGIREQNKQLRAEGKPTESVLKQLGTAFFSWNTLISVGVTLLTVYGKNIVEFVSAMFQGTKALDEFAARQNSINEAFKDSSVKEAAKDVMSLKINIKLAKDGMIDKEKVVKQYNESIGKTTGLVTSLDDAERQLVKNGDDYISMMLYKAAATIALDKAAQSFLEGQQDQIELERKLAELRKKQLSDNAEERGLQQFDEIALQGEINALKNKIELRKKESANLITSLNAEADAIAKRNKWNIFGDNDKDAKAQEAADKKAEAARKKAERDQERLNKKEEKEAEDLSKAKEEAAKKVFDANYELMKEDANNSAETAKAIQDNEEKTLNERLQASIEYYANKQNLLDIEQTKEIYEANGNQDAITAINAKYAKSREQLLKEHYGTRSIIIKSASDHELEVVLKALDKEKEKYDQYSLEALRDLDQQYIDGLLSTEDYHKQREYIAANSMQNSLLAQLNYGQKQLEILKAQGISTVELEKKLSALRQQIASGGAGIKGGQTEEAKMSAEEIKGIWMSNAASTTALLNDIAEAFNAAEERKYNKRIKAIDDEEKRRLDALDRLTLTEKERDERTKKIEIEAESRRQKAERDKISSMRRIASFQKAIDIAQIVTTTAAAIIGFLAKPGGYPGIALSIGAGITGAAQLAKAIATPLPQYAKGRKGGKAELALVGEVGAEVIDTPGEAPRVVDRPTITWLKEGASVIPTNEALMKSLFAPTMNVLANNGKPVTTDSYGKAMIEAYERGADKIERAVKANSTNITFRGDISKVIYKTSRFR